MRRAVVVVAGIFAVGVLVAGTATAMHVFRDVPDDHTHAEGIHWAAGQRLVQGYGDGRFGPDDPISRGQLATILNRQGAWTGPVYTLTPECGSLDMVVIDHNRRGSGPASVEYSVDGGNRMGLPTIPPDDPLVFTATAPGIVSLFVDDIAWAHAPTAEACTP
jgi:hypothetical protein